MVTEMVERFLLVRPDLSFTYKVEDDIVYNVRSETLNDRFSVISQMSRSFNSYLTMARR